MRKPSKKREKIHPKATKSFLCIDCGEFYMDCPEGIIMTEEEWWETHDEDDWIPVFEPEK